MLEIPQEISIYVNEYQQVLNSDSPKHISLYYTSVVTALFQKKHTYYIHIHATILLKVSKFDDLKKLHFTSTRPSWSIARAEKWSIFIVQKLALHKNGVEFRQQFNGAICTSLATPYDDVRRRAI